MDNFFNYISKPMPKEDVDTWFKVNNMVFEKINLYSDFSHTLNILVNETYLGDNIDYNETRISLNDYDNEKHFIWCWNKVIDNFSKENIFFNKEGEHLEYFKTFFTDVFYKQKEKKIRDSISLFMDDLFDLDKPFTKSDIDMITTVYKLLEKNMNKR